MTRFLSMVAVALVPATAAAHPGHGHTDGVTLGHYLTELGHAGLFAAAVAVGLIGLWKRPWQRSARRG